MQRHVAQSAVVRYGVAAVCVTATVNSFVSNQAERILGYPVERWLSEPTFWKDHLHLEDREWAVPFCEQIIKGHGGRLWATPNATHGATFHFTLPGMR